MDITIFILVSVIWWHIIRSSGPKNDVLESWQLGFQDTLTPMAEGTIGSPYYLMVFLIVICLMIFWMLYRGYRSF